MTWRTWTFKEKLFAQHPIRCCHYCGEWLTRTDATTDHKVPRSRGGPSRNSNFVLACQPCNSAKGALPYEVFKKLMAPVKRQRKEIRREFY